MSTSTSDRMVALKHLQLRRLQTTYADFLADRRYRTTCDFFFGKVYTAEDSSARDAEVAEFHAKLKRVLGGDIIRCLGQIIDLQSLTVSLDERLARELAEMGAPIDCDIPTYETAYRTCDNFGERVRQIELLVDNLGLAHKIFRRFGIGPGLFALHEFETIRGHGRVTGFLWDAYRAIHKLRDIRPLARAIATREQSRLDRIYAVTG